ncbi:FAD-dependent monooxygenase [Rhizohabitans arisaemae]|uniref:FAD-dependent monooxygenase n=1 Tax=Rhizohabitans arisaemae TaxID=2720610 RepID=UPI0024B0D397|nr:FAD-dependent monooxygenase [Rhizohabitans arisaemae]
MGAARHIAIIGAGPAGLFLARMIGLTRPDTLVEVHERGEPGDVFGFGVSLSDRTMHGLARNDPKTHRRIVEASVTTSGLELRPPGAALRYDGFGLLAVSRHALLSILREQAEQVGAVIRYGSRARAEDLDADVIAVAEGARSAHRRARRADFGTRVYTGAARYVWLGTSHGFGDSIVLAFVRTAYGPMAAHCYPYAAGMSTVVIELDDAVWRNAGFAGDGEIDDASLTLLTEIFADHLDGHKLVGNKSRWGRFDVVTNERWWHGNTVLLGDAAHTAHFTVGSGTKMALEDAIGLASALRGHDDPAAAFTAYERDRREPVSRTQGLAEPSMRWWETYGRRLHLPPARFGLHFMTRTGAVGHRGLRRRCPERLAEAEAVYRRECGLGDPPDGAQTDAADAPLPLAGVRLPHRRAVVYPDAPPGDGLVLVRDGAAPPPGRTGPLGSLGPAADADASRPRFAEIEVPAAPEWTEEGDALVRHAAELRERGVDGVLLRGSPAGDGWDAVLRHADRVGTETGLPVAVGVPHDWAARPHDEESAAEPWPARVHLALLSGRIDLVVAEP